MNLIYINDDNLILFNKKGIFPFPLEKEDFFLQRVKKMGQKEGKSEIDEEAREQLKSLFDIEPDWIEFEYSNQGIHFWEAAYVEICGSQFKMRLKKRFENKKKYLAIYERSEVIAHECVHLGRMHLNGTKYEEIFAYHTSKGLRRWLGAIIQTSKEVMMLFLFSIASIFSDLLDFRKVGMAFKAALLTMILTLLGRLYHRKKMFKRVLKKIEKLLIDPKKSLALLYRLSDHEIDLFSQYSLEEVRQFMKDQGDLRWDMIKKAYPIK